MRTTLKRIAIWLTLISILLPTTALWAAPEPPPALAPVEAVEISNARELPRKPQVYIVQFKDEPVPGYEGGLMGYSATSPQVTGASKLDTQESSVVAYRDYLRDKQEAFIQSELSGKAEVRYRYQLAMNGIAVEMSPTEADRIAQLDEVESVIPNWTETLLTDAGPAWVGAEDVWSGAASGTPTQGEGIVIGILDTGINMDHPSFADIGGDGYNHSNPRGKFYGWCDPLDPDYDSTLTCNHKLIGVWSADSDSPEDYQGHGSHVASTAAGNVLTMTVNAPTTTVTRTISGMAPHANIIAYNIEADQGGGSATGAGIIAATEAAIDHGVDVINYSFGGGAADPWATADHWLNVRDAGIIVATSAGNAGPGAGTVGSPANAPWMLTVANSTHNRAMVNALTHMTSDGSSLPDIKGRSITSDYGPAPIVYAGEYTAAITQTYASYNITDTARMCLVPFVAGSFVDEIVVCDRGEIARVAKGAHVKAGGAKGYVLANAHSNGDSLNADAHVLPAVHITYGDGVTLKNWISANTNPMATIAGTTVELADAYGDIMSASSSRGPNYTGSILKPEVTAPGTYILAAVEDSGAAGSEAEYAFYSGTSMASPHVAGVAALVRKLHPGWSAAEIHSALMTTAINADGIVKEDESTPSNPFDRGAGRAYASRAVQAGFVLDETTANFQAADPAAGGDPTTLNLASFANDNCLAGCSWTRTLSSTMDTTVNWTASVTGTDNLTLTVEPASFALAAGATQVITVSVDVTALPLNAWAFGQVTLTPDTADTVSGVFPLAVKPTSGVLPEAVNIETRRNAGSTLLEDLEALEITDLQFTPYGLIAADVHTFNLEEDPTNDIDAGEMYDDLSQVYYKTFGVPAGAKRVVAEILETTSPDLDIAVGFDNDNDGKPELSEELCLSATSGPMESCDLMADELMGAGTYWVLVLNWDDSSPGAADAVKLGVGVVPDNDAANISADDPGAVAQATPFDLRLYWDESTMAGGDRWYGVFELGTDPSHTQNIGAVPITVNRYGDPVQKTASWIKDGDAITLTYELSVQPNVTEQKLTYTLTDTIPSGLTYVPGSATGDATVSGSTITWTVDSELPYLGIQEDDLYGYLSLPELGVQPAPCTTDCDETILTVNEVNFYYRGTHYTSMEVISNGFIVPGGGAEGDLWLNQAMPDTTNPNNVIAPFWTDLDMDGGNGVGSGIWYLESLTDGVNDFTVIEWNGAQLYDSPGITHTFQIWILDGTDIMWFTYDHLPGSSPFGTIGIEDSTGSKGYTYYYDGQGTLPDGSKDLVLQPMLPDPVDLNYKVTVDDVPAAMDGKAYVNTVDHIIDNVGAEVEAVSHTFQLRTLFMPVVFRNFGN
jgi:uncharacterized repeat protein (TIGR01451 family)